MSGLFLCALYWLWTTLPGVKTYYPYSAWKSLLLNVTLFAFPLLFGGLGVASCLFDSSACGTVTLVHSIVGAPTFQLDVQLKTVSQARMYHHKCMDTIYTNDFDKLLPSFDPSQQRVIL